MELRCIRCDTSFACSMMYSCSRCGGILEIIGGSGERKTRNSDSFGNLWKYFDRLPLQDSKFIVSLGEGMTPVHEANRLVNILGFQGHLYLKDETVNPTGSFKDRMLSVGISRAMELGLEKIVCASSGNAGASAAAYAAKAGLEAVILAPAHTPKEKLAQIAAYGPRVILVEGHYSNAYRMAQKLSEQYGYTNLTTTYINPYAVEALKTIGYELYEQLDGRVPDYIFVPVGAGPLLKGIFRGFRELMLESDGRTPKMVAVQAEGCAPIVRAYESGHEEVFAWTQPQTIASGISDPLFGYESDGTYTLQLVKQSLGFAVSVSDDEIRQSMRTLAEMEGVFAEPTAACSYAAMKKAIESGAIPQGSSVVCMITAHGFKDFQVFQQMMTNSFEYANDQDSPLI